MSLSKFRSLHLFVIPSANLSQCSLFTSCQLMQNRFSLEIPSLWSILVLLQLFGIKSPIYTVAIIILWSLSVIPEVLMVSKFVIMSLAKSDIQIWSMRVAVVPFDQVQSVECGCICLYASTKFLSKSVANLLWWCESLAGILS